MMNLNEQEWLNLARASSASGKIIEAHSDSADNVCRVVLEMGDALRGPQLRESILQLWMADGFIASPSRDGAYLMINGQIGDAHFKGMDLVNLVAEQLKTHMRGAMNTRADNESPSLPLAVLASQQQLGSAVSHAAH